MKIAFTGTHGTGKTTLAHQLVYKLKREGIDAGLLNELARNCPFPINESRTKKSQVWIILNQIIKEMEEEDKSGILVCDRSILDGYCYYSSKFGLSSILEPLIKEHLKTYDLIIRVPIRKGLLKEDKKRSTNPEFQKEIDITIDKMLKRLKVRYINYEDMEDNIISKIKELK